VSFVRRDRGEELLVTLNMTNRPFVGMVDVQNASSFTDITPDGIAKVRLTGLPAITLESWGFRIFKRALQ